MIKTYHVFTMCPRTDGPTDGLTAHSDYTAYMRVVQYCFDFEHMLYFKGTVESIGAYILEQSVSIRAVRQLMGGGGSRMFRQSHIPKI